MLKLIQPIVAINGFEIGDKVRLKDGDGRPHIIKSFSIDGLKEFFFVVQFVDGTEAMLDNISPLPSNLDEAAQKVEDYYDVGEEHGYLYCHRGDIKDAFKAGAEWMAGQGYTIEETVYFERLCDENRIMVDLGWGEPERGGFNPGDKVIVQIRKK